MNALMPMTPAAADWVYDVVLTPAYRRSVGADATDEEASHITGPAILRMCPCQWGTCHGCQAGHHAGCVRARIVTAVTHVLGTSGSVLVLPVDGGGSMFVAVWLAGRQCGWRCGCGCGAPAEQLDLFALAGGTR